MIHSQKRRRGSSRLAFNVWGFCLWQPLCWIPCWLTAYHWWWLDHDGYHGISRAASLLSEIILDSLGEEEEEEDRIKELGRNTNCIPFIYLNDPPTEFFGLNLMANPFWLDSAVRRKGSITAAKWENNCAAQRRLWSIHLDTTRLAGRDENMLAQRMEVTSVINKGVLSGGSQWQEAGNTFSILLLNDEADNCYIQIILKVNKKCT